MRVSAHLTAVLLTGLFLCGCMVDKKVHVTDATVLDVSLGDWKQYHHWILAQDFDAFADVDPVVLRDTFAPLLNDPAYAENPDFLLAFGSGLTNAVCRSKVLTNSDTDRLYAEALPPLRQAAAKGILFAMSEYAWMLRDGLGCAKDPHGASEWLMKLHTLVLRDYNGDHPCVVAYAPHLARYMQEKGDLSDAEGVLCVALAFCEKNLGNENPSTARILAELAGHHYRYSGNPAEAVRLYTKALEIYRHTQGSSHPATLGTMLSLAVALHSEKRDEEAEVFFRQALDTLRKSNGNTHADTVIAMRMLANFLVDRGILTEAAALRREVLAATEGTLGETHPDTLAAMNSLAALLSRKKDYEAAASQYRRILDIQSEMHKDSAPDTLTTMKNLAIQLRATGDYAGAEPLLSRILEVRRQEFGEADPHTLQAMYDLALLLQIKGDYAVAEKVHRQALEVRQKTLGITHPDTLASMNSLASLLRDKGDFAGAELMFRQIMETGRNALGENHPVTLAAMNNLANLLGDKGNYAAAEALHRRTLALRQEKYGEKHPDTLTSMNNLASLLVSKADYAAAEPLLRQALKIRENTVGETHPDTLTSMSNLAVLLQKKGDYAAAETLDRRLLALRQEKLGPSHPSTLTSMNNLAGLLTDKGDYTAAEPFCRQALDVGQKTYGETSSTTLTSMDNMAFLLMAKGDYAAAQPLLQRTLEIQMHTFGETHPDTLMAMNNLAGLFQSKGDYAAAESHFRRVLDIKHREHGTDQSSTGVTLNNLAGLLYNKGDDEAAEQLYREALAIYQKTLGPEHPETAAVLDGLALVLLRTKRDYGAAEGLLRQSLEIRRKMLGEENPATAASYNNLAGLLNDTGNYAAAEPCYRKALEIHRKIFGEKHPYTAVSRNSYATMLHSQGNYEDAEPLFRQALEINRTMLGMNHQQTARSLNNLALHHCVTGNDAAAVEEAAQALTSQNWISENVFATSSERQRLAYQANYAGGLQVLVTVALRERVSRGDAVRTAGLWTLRSKNVVLDSLLEDRQSLGPNPESLSIAKQLGEIRQHIAGLARAAGKAQEDKEQQNLREEVVKLAAEREQLEQKLAALVPRYAGGRRASKVTFEDLQRVLSTGEVLLEFLRIWPVATAEEIKLGKEAVKGSGYLRPVYVTFAFCGGTADPILVNLGDAATIDLLGKQSQEAMRKGAATTTILQELYAKVWAPLVPYLKDAKRVIVSPDGNLNFVPFAALITPNNRFLAETVELGYMASGRDLVRRIDRTTTATPALFGDPAFGEKERTKKSTDRGPLLAATVTLPAALTDRDRAAMEGLRFPQLSGTRKEVEQIRGLYDSAKKPIAVFLGQDATKGQFMALHRPEVLHLATHGFFLPDVKPSPNQGSKVRFMDNQTGWSSGRSSALNPVADTFVGLVDNPMKRSGLAFTGAALTLAQKGIVNAEDGVDGIVTADEIASLDLWGTKLVVLSACDTGLGDLQAGEGVMGLRRAFVQAGAQNLMLTLWPIQDEFTANVMLDFYREFLKSGDGLGALCQAQRNAIRLARAKGQTANPRTWAPFLLSVAGSRTQGQ